ncbi:hypothetical protein O181_000560 [Austropuccinia psidii MF-1]|uniref:Integrase catalytic domain-containing protein n=1 Tax=Austropuccinia psidii MF-1 TaxID=1389203 RepID=A0A9Q3B992_9BASI|nr:hypothetical protein [Austropuccinia psidii MF-1]
MIKRQEPSRPWEAFNIYWVTDLPPVGDRSYNTCPVVVESFCNIPIFLTFHKDDTAMDKDLLTWNRVVSWIGLLTKIISDRYPKLNSELWKNLPQLFGEKLSFSSYYHPYADGLAEKMIQTLEDIVRIICAYNLELKYCDGFTHY